MILKCYVIGFQIGGAYSAIALQQQLEEHTPLHPHAHHSQSSLAQRRVKGMIPHTNCAIQTSTHGLPQALIGGL